MPPSNSPAVSKDTPVQTHSLPPLIYFYPPAETAPGGEGVLENPTSHPQPPTGTEIFPRTTLNQTLLPQPPSHNVPLYGQLPPLPPLGGDNEIRRSGYVPQIIIREPDTLSPPGGDDENRPRRSGYVPQIIIREPGARPNDGDRDQAYGPRIPALRPGQRQSLYDWAPAVTGPGPLYFAGGLELPWNPIANRRENEGTGPIFGRMRYSSPPLGPSTARLRPMGSEARLRPITSERGHRAQQDNSANRPLSTASGLRRYTRGQPQRSRSIWAGYAADAERERERVRQRDRDRELREIDNAIDAAIDATWVSPRAGGSGVGVGHRHTATARRNSIARESISFTSCKELEVALKYLERLRGCNTVGESLRLALSLGFTRDTAWSCFDGCDCSIDDFLLDTRMLKALETSWLDIGGTFWGSQTTLSSNSTTSSISDTQGYSPNRWTVQVNISGIDYANLRLNGTMEAYADWEKHAEHHNHNYNHNENSSANAPSPSLATTANEKSTADHLSPSTPSSGSRDTMTPIVTFLEGEILDFRTHTLQTTSYPSTITDDALYWKKLEPFSFCDSETLVQALTSKKFMQNLMQDYVLMRWKEKCFIKGGGKVSPTLGRRGDGDDDDDDDGDDDEDGDRDTEGFGMGGGGLLTIGGFYYVSLRRSDGFIKGFYYDPKSTPYQELLLRPKKRVFPTYEFR